MRELENLSSAEEFPFISSCSFSNWGEVVHCCGFVGRTPPVNGNKRWGKSFARDKKPLLLIHACSPQSNVRSPLSTEHLHKSSPPLFFLFPSSVAADPEKLSVERGACISRAIFS